MATPNSRQTLKDYCLRQLGHPVLEVNVDDDQLEDRIDDALQIFQDYHFDGTQKLLLKHQVTGTTINLVTLPAPSGTFNNGEIITGSTSNATAVIVKTNEDTTTGSGSTTQLIVKKCKDANGFANNDTSALFTQSETITGKSSGVTAKFNTISIGDVDNHYLPVDDSIIGIEQVFAFDHAMNDVNMFDVRYQLHLNDIYDLSSSSLQNYDFTQRHISYLENIFNQAPRFSFNRHTDRLLLDIDWDDDEAAVDKIILFEVYKIVDPNTYTQVYNDLFLKKYLTSLFKRQWGSNLIKFEGMQLPGGITLNGRQLYDDAVQELERIDEEMQLKYQLPDDFMVG